MDDLIERVMKPYRSNVRNRALLCAALRVALKVEENGPEYEANPDGPDHFACTVCGEMAIITYHAGRVFDVEEIAHAKDCALAEFTRLWGETRFFSY